MRMKQDKGIENDGRWESDLSKLSWEIISEMITFEQNLNEMGGGKIFEGNLFVVF